MRKIILFFIILLSSQIVFGQGAKSDDTKSNKGKYYLYWGWNRGWFTNSDISFKGNDYDFVLKDVVAYDRPTPFALNPYFHLGWFTLPQYNFRFGYYFNDNWEISYGMDHMKYVMLQEQTVSITGEIANSQTNYDGVYSGDNIRLKQDFLKFEHTDGLNYGNFELRYSRDIYKYKILTVKWFGGGGLGFLLPKTNSTLLSKERHDDFHLAGFGLGAVTGFNITIWDHFFVQSEYKLGYINMPDIRTTNDKVDKASQDFFFSQLNIVFGYSFRLKSCCSKD